MERWKIIPGWEHYSISDHGNVRNNKTGKVLVHTIRKGYHGAVLYKNGDSKIIRIHNWMVRVFTDNWNKNLVAAHMDGNKDNNKLENINLITQQENIRQKKIHGTMPVGSKHHMAKLDENKVKKIKKLLKEKTPSHKTLSNRKIANMFGVCETTIKNIESRKIWQHVK
jgi:hypothetical protein